MNIHYLFPNFPFYIKNIVKNTKKVMNSKNKVFSIQIYFSPFFFVSKDLHDCLVKGFGLVDLFFSSAGNVVFGLPGRGLDVDM